MLANWGLDMLKSGTGVIDVGGDPGFVASALLKRGIPTVVVDPTWGLTGKGDKITATELADPGNPSFSAFQENFDEDFCRSHREVIEGASAIISLYGDEATAPSLQIAAAFGKPSAIVPCPECVRFFPQQKQNYDGYVEFCLAQGNAFGGRFELVQLHGAPFSRQLVVQSPFPVWGKSFSSCNGFESLKLHQALSVPVSILKDMGVLHQVMWKMELARQQGKLELT